MRLYNLLTEIALVEGTTSVSSSTHSTSAVSPGESRSATSARSCDADRMTGFAADYTTRPLETDQSSRTAACPHHASRSGPRTRMKRIAVALADMTRNARLLLPWPSPTSADRRDVDVNLELASISYSRRRCRMHYRIGCVLRRNSREPLSPGRCLLSDRRLGEGVSRHLRRLRRRRQQSGAETN